MGCQAAHSFCSTELSEPLAATGLNNYDLSKKCGDTPLCYSEAEFVRLVRYRIRPLTESRRDIASLLNSPYIRKLIKTDAQPAKFLISSDDVNHAFVGAGDFSDVTTTSYLSGLLERGIRILIYVGMYDSACSWLDNERMTRIIEWSGQAAFANTPLREWKADGKSAGKVRSSGLLTFATIYGAGHLVSSVCVSYDCHSRRGRCLTTSRWSRSRWSRSGWRRKTSECEWCMLSVVWTRLFLLVI
jgi:carboxypeptidase C (cathepsin A)